MSVKTRVNIIIWMIYTRIVPDKNVFSWLIFFCYNKIYLHTAGGCHTKIKFKEALSGVISWIQRRRKMRSSIGLPGGHAYFTSEHWLLSATVFYSHFIVKGTASGYLLTPSCQQDLVNWTVFWEEGGATFWLVSTFWRFCLNLTRVLLVCETILCYIISLFKRKTEFGNIVCCAGAFPLWS